MNDIEVRESNPKSPFSIFLFLVSFVGVFFLIFKYFSKRDKSEEATTVRNSDKIIRTNVRIKGGWKKDALSGIGGSRRNRILDMVRDHQSLSVADVAKILPLVTKRTLRRDFDILEKEGLIKQTGKTKSSKYTFVRDL